MTRESASAPRMTEKERYYRELLRKQQRNGTSLRELAEEEGIPAGRIRWWKNRVAKLDRRRAEATSTPRSSSRAPKASGEIEIRKCASRTEALIPLLPVRVVNGAKCAGGIEPGFEVLLRSGHLVRVPCSFETDSFGRLVQVLEGTC